MKFLNDVRISVQLFMFLSNYFFQTIPLYYHLYGNKNILFLIPSKHEVHSKSRMF